MQTIFNRCTKYAIIRDPPTNEGQRELKETNCMKAKGGCQDRVHSDQIVLNPNPH
jgi:hypothetical protein